MGVGLSDGSPHLGDDFGSRIDNIMKCWVVVLVSAFETVRQIKNSGFIFQVGLV